MSVLFFSAAHSYLLFHSLLSLLCFVLFSFNSLGVVLMPQGVVKLKCMLGNLVKKNPFFVDPIFINPSVFCSGCSGNIHQNNIHEWHYTYLSKWTLIWKNNIQSLTLTPHNIWYIRYESLSWSRSIWITCTRLASINSVTR